MPTPSPNQSSDPPPSTSSYPFSTCPDDLQYSSHYLIESRSNPALDGPTSTDFESESQREMDIGDDIIIDNRASTSPLSRDATISPAPQSSTTAVTSPEPLGSDAARAIKIQETGPDGPTPQTSSARLIHHTGQHSRDSGGSDLAAVQEEDAACTPPSMGSDYSSIRVCVVLACHIASSY
jgi:hypothetical protein